MSNKYGPKIITDGLVLHLDAGDRKSYSGTGTTWYDRSKYKNHGTLTNGPTFDSGSGGSISFFDGSNHRVYINDDPIYRLKTSMSFCSFFKLADLGGETLFSRGPQTYLGFYWIMIYFNRPYFQYRKSDNTGYLAKQSSVNLSTSTWYYLVFSLGSDILNIYINGELTDSFDISDLGLFEYDYTLSIGSYTDWTNNWKFRGNIASHSIYNKTLSAAEILQNYNTVKGRFNL